MLLKVTAKRQVTFPRSVLESLGVRQGDRIELIEGPDGYLLRPRRIDYSRLARSGTRFLPATRRLSFAHSARRFTIPLCRIDKSVPTRAAKSALTALIHQNPSPHNRRRGP